MSIIPTYYRPYCLQEKTRIPACGVVVRERSVIIKRKEKRKRKKRSRLEVIRDIRNKVNIIIFLLSSFAGKERKKRLGGSAVLCSVKHIFLSIRLRLWLQQQLRVFFCQAKTEVRHVNRHIQYEYQPLLTGLLACLLACPTGYLPSMLGIHCISSSSREIQRRNEWNNVPSLSPKSDFDFRI